MREFTDGELKTMEKGLVEDWDTVIHSPELLTLLAKVLHKRNNYQPIFCRFTTLIPVAGGVGYTRLNSDMGVN